MCLPKASERPYFSHIPLFFFCCFFASCFMWFPFLVFLCHCNFSSFKIQNSEEGDRLKNLDWSQRHCPLICCNPAQLPFINPVLLLQAWLCCCLDWLFLQVSWWHSNNNKNTFCPSVCPPVSLNISPKRELYLRRDSVSLSCVYGGWTVDGWAVRRLTGEQHFGWTDGSSCIVSQLHPSDSGVYWCETSAGQWSDPVNISVSGTEITCPILSGVCPLVCILLMD